MARVTFVDLFAGCGGLSLGLSLAGMRGLFAIERDHMAFETFSANLLSNRKLPIDRFRWPFWLEKKAWDIDELLLTHKKNLKSLRGQVDVLAGGPPCQGFSFAGQRNKNDPRNFLFERYVETVEIIHPKILILENVPGMRVAHGNKTKRKRKASFLDELVEQLDFVGYTVDARIFDASRFGVPQYRSRLIVIGLRKDLAGYLDAGIQRIFHLIEEKRANQLDELNLPENISSQQAISDLKIRRRKPSHENRAGAYHKECDYMGPETQFQKLMHHYHVDDMDSMRPAQHRIHVQDRYDQILDECKRGVALNPVARKRYGLKKNRSIPLASNKPALTVTTLPDDILHYSEPRILTVRECARLQSFPDWFLFKGKYTTGGHKRRKECPRYTQVGNAVPPLLARAIGHATQDAIDEIDQQKANIFCRRSSWKLAKTA